MKRLFYYLFAALCAGTLAGCSDEPSATEGEQNKTEQAEPVVFEEQGEISYISSLQLNENEEKVVAGNNAFAWNYFAKTCENAGDKNVVMSPLAVSIAMTMLANGAYENSPVRAEILNLLGYGDCNIKDVNSCAMKLADGINRLDKNVSLSVANSLWVKNYTTTLSPEYISLLKNEFVAESYPINSSSFVNDVNKWCALRTDGMIDNLLSANSPAPDVAIINATYFKGAWSEDYVFSEGLNTTGNFKNANGTYSNAEYMNQVMVYKTRNNDMMEAAEIPFGDGNYAFYMLKPGDGYSVKDCCEALSDGKWNDFMKLQSHNSYLELKLPKFEVDFASNVKDLLSEMGMTHAMNDLDYKFACKDGLKVESVMQKTTFRVTEDGAEAAAVEDINWWSGSAGEGESPTPRAFHLDRPFIYLIAEKNTGTIIFMGCLNKF